MNVYVVMKNKITELKDTIADLEAQLDICKALRPETVAELEAELEACEAANARLLAQSRIKSVPGYQAGGWRQWEKRL